jgi:hypothetical protein
MKRFEDALKRIAADLGDLGVGWVLVGGLAIAISGVYSF